MSRENSSLMIISNFFGGRCGWVTIVPRMALQDVVWMLIARSVKARDCGSYMSRPPCFKSSCDIRRE